MDRYFISCLSLDYKLNNYDASISDCSDVLTKDPRHIKGWLVELVVALEQTFFQIV